MINLTDSAIKKIAQSLDPGFCLNIGVKAGGCSGYTYVLQPIEIKDINVSDIILNFSTFKVVINEKSLDLLVGTTIDYEEGMFQSGFKFNNPSATRCCGCGESFSC